MAYRRPLTPTQMVVITILWLALVIWIISSGLRLDGLTILMLVCSGVTVFYPIIKSSARLLFAWFNCLRMRLVSRSHWRGRVGI